MKKRKKSILFVILVGTAVVLFWRGAWGLMDVLIFPNNEILSYLSSLVTGLLILYITHTIVDELI